MILVWNVFVIGLICVTTTHGALKSDHIDEAIRFANEIRSWHGAPPCKRHPSPKFHHDVQQYAQRLANYEGKGHSSGMAWMENLFGTGNLSPNKTLHALTATRVWYSEIRWYDFNGPTLTAGHMTCLIWNTVTHMSFGVATNKPGELTIVVGAVYPACNLPYFDSLRLYVHPPVSVEACMRATQISCQNSVPNYSACIEPYHDMIRCIE